MPDPRERGTATSPLTIGVDLGGTKCLGVASTSDGTVVAEHRVGTPDRPDGILDVVAGVAGQLRSNVGADRVRAVGVGAPGLVDRQGLLRFAPNLALGEPLAIGPEIASRLGVPVRADNDATCATWGERVFGAASGAYDMVLVTLGTGIGGGIVSGGELHRGANGFAGEIGHMVVDPNGPPCPCGQRGCWERYASGSGLARLSREAALAGRAARVLELAGGDVEAVRGEHLTAAVAEGDEEARAVLDHFAWWLALGLANLANVFDPECFVIGGGLAEIGDDLLVPARSAFEGLVEGASRRPAIPILAATLGERAGAVGAAALAWESVQVSAGKKRPP
ncbi:MAG: ROK family protein [Acidimicrobiales bacterium]